MVLRSIPAERLKEALPRLCELEEAPWGDLRGRPIDARGVARRIKDFEVRPHVVRIGGQTPRGYDRTDFHDAWARYLPPLLLPSDTATAATSVTTQVTAPQSVADENPVADTSATRKGSAPGSRPLTRENALVADVALPEGSRRHRAVDLIEEAFPGAQKASDRDIEVLELAAQANFVGDWNDHCKNVASEARLEGGQPW